MPTVELDRLPDWPPEAGGVTNFISPTKKWIHSEGGLIEEVDKVRLKGLQVVLLTLDCTEEEVEEEECQPRHLSDEEVDSLHSGE